MADERQEQEIQEGFYQHNKTDMVTYVEKKDGVLVSYLESEEEPLAILNEVVFLQNFRLVDPRKVIGKLEARIGWIKEKRKKQPITVPASNDIPMVV